MKAWTASHAGRVPLAELLGDLDRQGRRSRLPLPGVHRAHTFDAADRRDRTWWPQGVTTSADADPSGLVHGRRLVVVSWYAKDGQGSRVTFFDLDTHRYRHVLLVRATDEGWEPLRVHAGGIVWHRDHLHVAATARGVLSARIAELVRDGERYLLPVEASRRPESVDGEAPFRFSFLSLDRSSEPSGLLAGEYGRGQRSRRLARFALGPGADLELVDVVDGVRGMQGLVRAHDRLYVTVSHGPWVPGSLYVGRVGEPGSSWRRHRWATPMGPEDVSYWPATDELWSVSEHPRRRWIFSLRRERFA